MRSLAPLFPLLSGDLRLQHDVAAGTGRCDARRPPAAASFPTWPQSNPITTATMKLALSSLLIGSAAAFAPAPAARSATQLHESKVRKRRKLSRATFDSRLSCLQVGFELQAAAVDSSSVIAEEYPITKICRLLQIATSVRVANRKRAAAYLFVPIASTALFLGFLVQWNSHLLTLHSSLFHPNIILG